MAQNGTCGQFGSLSRLASTASAKGRALAALENAGEPVVVPAPSEDLDDRLVFVGVDDRGVELEIIAVQLPYFLFVIHVMPTTFRR